jgi:hypothetical protein
MKIDDNINLNNNLVESDQEKTYLSYKEALAEFQRLSRELDYVNNNIDASFDVIKSNIMLYNEKIKELEEIKKICIFILTLLISLIISILFMLASYSTYLH